MLERTITPKESNSRFYLHNERLVKEWESFVEERNGKIEGEVNSYFISFVAVFKLNQLKVEIKALRQLSNNVAEVHHDYLITKSTDITIEGLTNKVNWRIRKKRKCLDILSHLFFKVITVHKNDKYVLLTKDNINIDYPQKIIHQSLNVAEVRDVKFENGQLIIRFYNFLGPLSVREVINSLF